MDLHYINHLLKLIHDQPPPFVEYDFLRSEVANSDRYSLEEGEQLSKYLFILEDDNLVELVMTEDRIITHVRLTADGWRRLEKVPQVS